MSFGYLSNPGALRREIENQEKRIEREKIKENKYYEKLAELDEMQRLYEKNLDFC